MLKAIYYKEWIKLRGLVAVLSLIYVSMLIYTLVDINRNVAFSGAARLWEAIVSKDFVLVSMLKMLPLFAGCIMGLFQFVPEMHKKRMKLTLHLPASEKRILFLMLSFGLGVVSILTLLSFGISILFSAHFFASNTTLAWALFLLPYFCGGITTYMLTAWICIEPLWKQRVKNAIVALLFVNIYMYSAMSGAYIYFAPILVGVTLLSILFPFSSMQRFKDGVL